MRIHVVSLPHTQVVQHDEWCAYTQKVRRFGTMLNLAGHEGIFYCGEQFEGEGEHVTIVTAEDRERWFGPAEAPGGVWNENVGFDHWDASEPCWVEMNARAVAEISKRWQEGDAVGLHYRNPGRQSQPEDAYATGMTADPVMPA